ncbi:MAG: hypothetical protein VKP57_09455 [Candidatus Sericytochromatia bacterium]|nr:hypothetical protein [Candidatus Sericytochromatia bacterium]
MHREARRSWPVALFALVTAVSLAVVPPAHAKNKNKPGPKPAAAKPAPPPPPPPKPKPEAPKPKPEAPKPKPEAPKPKPADKKDKDAGKDKKDKDAGKDKKDKDAGKDKKDKGNGKGKKGKDSGKDKKSKGNGKAELVTKKKVAELKLTSIKVPGSKYPPCYPAKPKDGDRCSGGATSTEAQVSGGKKITWSRNVERYEEAREVVAIYRSRKENLLKNLSNKTVGAQKVSGKKDVKEALKNADYGDVKKFVAKEVSTVKDKGVDGGRTNEIILLDKNTGQVVGTVPIKGFKNGQDISGKASKLNEAVKKTLADLTKSTDEGKDLSVQLEGKKKSTEYVEVVGYTFHASPIILDLAGRGKPDLLASGPWKLRPGRQLAAEGLRLFDLDGKGSANWEWVGPGAGLLVWDPEGTGRITSGKQLFGNYTWGETFKDGYRALERLDADADGYLRGSELAKLAIWVDADSDAVSDPGEVRPCVDYGITSLTVRAERDRFGNAHATQGFSRDGNGPAVGASWDWISYGKSRPTEGIYVWIGTREEDNVGGYFKLKDDAGTLVGRSFPTFGPDASENPDIMVAVPIEGRVTGPGSFRWTTPVPDGSMTTEVRFEDEGRHLYGRTTIRTARATVSYPWQGRLIDGEPIGQGLRFTRSVEE